MHPILWTIGPLQIRAYGLMLALSFMVGIGFALYRARKAGLDTRVVSNVCLLILFTSIAGSRLLYVLENPSSYRTGFRALSIWEGGLSMLGGVVLAIAATFVYLKVERVSFRQVADVVVPSFALGVFLTRIGCFLNGCCFGQPCDLPWGMIFPKGSLAGQQFPGLPIHPTQLYSSGYGLAVFGILLGAEGRKRGAGYVCGLFFVLYAAGRFLVEFLRYQEPSLVAFTVSGVDISRYQLICVGLFAMGWHFLRAGKARAV